MSSLTLHRIGGSASRVGLGGHLRPATAGRRLLVQTTHRRSGTWSPRRHVRTGKDGTYRVTVHRGRRGMYVRVYWAVHHGGRAAHSRAVLVRPAH